MTRSWAWRQLVEAAWHWWRLEVVPVEPGLARGGTALVAEQQRITASVLRHRVRLPRPGAQPAQPQQQATPLHGNVGVGSASKGTGVMVYNKQEQYSNWEFLAQLQQRTDAGAAGGARQAGGTADRRPDRPGGWSCRGRRNGGAGGTSGSERWRKHGAGAGGAGPG